MGLIEWCYGARARSHVAPVSSSVLTTARPHPPTCSTQAALAALEGDSELLALLELYTEHGGTSWTNA